MLLFIIIAFVVIPVIAVLYAGVSDAVSDAKFRKDFGIY